MGLQPIDLSTIYTQMDKVAKYAASQNQVSQLAAQQRQEKLSSEELQKSKTVKETKEKSSAAGIKKDGSGNNSSYAFSKGEKNKDDSQEDESYTQMEFTDPKLGQHIDIRG